MVVPLPINSSRIPSLLRYWLTLSIAVCGFSSAGGARLQAQVEFPYRHDEVYAGQLKSPGDFFGRPLGSRFTPHHEVWRYCQYVAETSPRATLVSYGRSAGGRELFYLVIGSEVHLKDLENIRSNQLRLADPRRVSPETLESLLLEQPAVCWFSYNVHGNESSCTEAALRTIYELVDGESPAIQTIREEVVLILDPLLNPDGRERYLNWYHQVAQEGGNPDPAAREHREPWPGGRSNHYYFDLNRDWAWQSQIETQQRLVHYLRWQPLVHGDFHEMSADSHYFFFPAEEPINLNFPEHTRRWGNLFGESNAAAFDRFGWLYFTEEAYDLFYPGYGDSWPSLHGAIGMTYEQGGGSRAGLQYRRRHGEILTLRDRLHHHHVAALATLETVARKRQELERSYFEFRKSALELPKTSGVAEYIVPPGQGYLGRSLIDLLLKQGVEIERTTEEVRVESLFDYFGVDQEDVRLPAGSWIVSLEQPASRLAKALLEPRAEVPLVRFYDISAWSLPFALGLECYYSKSPVLVGRAPVKEVTPDAGELEGDGRYGYLLPWSGLPSARALSQLHRAGIQVRLVPERIRIDRRTYRSGVVLIPRYGNPEDLEEKLEQIARESRVTIRGIPTGRTEEGIDLGSDKTVALAPPQIAVATGEGVASNSYGPIWFLLEQKLKEPFTAFDLDDFDRLELERYRVLVFPEGRGFRRALDEKARTRLKNWIEKGGVLIAIGRSAAEISQGRLGLTRFKVAESTKSPEEEKKKRRKIAEIRRDRRLEVAPGAIYKVDLDLDHPLAMGMPAVVYAIVQGTNSFALSGDIGDVGAFTEKPAVSGYVSEENEAKLARRLYLAEERQGRGAIILFADDPNFRLFWRRLEGLFLNALYLRCEY